MSAKDSGNATEIAIGVVFSAVVLIAAYASLVAALLAGPIIFFYRSITDPTRWSIIGLSVSGASVALFCLLFRLHQPVLGVLALILFLIPIHAEAITRAASSGEWLVYVGPPIATTIVALWLGISHCCFHPPSD